MCLSTIKFKLQRIDDEIVGIGYKHISKANLDSLGRLNWAKIKKCDWTMNWSQAKHIYENLYTPGGCYPYGFHIFLKKEDADNYPFECNFGITVQVAFKDVLAFGTNRLYHNGKYGECIIADKMRIIGKA